jgi:DNA polymerase elongation subunit (family B)
VSYRNCVYNGRTRTIRLFTWDQSGNRIAYDTTFDPYIYIEDPTGDKTSIYNTKVKKKSFNNSYYRNKFIKDSGIKRIFENIPATQQFLIDSFWRENETPEFSEKPLKVVFLDIETYSPASEGFPDTNNPSHPINVITCYDTISQKFNTFGTGPYSHNNEDVIYTHCKSERDLFIKFIEYLEDDYPDVLSGWSSEFFDIPYIINRCERVMGEEFVQRLSPTGRVYSRDIIGKFGRAQKRYYIDGISCIDYMDIYKRFCLKLRESYKLDAIGELELGMNKIDYGNIDLATLADTDWNKFIQYNIMDVNIIVKLEEKLQYINLLKMLAYVGLTTLEGAMGTISVINGALAIRARHRGEVLSTFVRKDSPGKNPGAYVAEPKTGFKKNVVSFDANSLYPNVMISLNLSPETKIGRVEKKTDGVTIYHVSGKAVDLTVDKFMQFLNTEKCSLTKAGFLFSQKKKGIIPEFLDYYYKQRVQIKSELFDVKKKLSTLKKTDADYKALRYESERLNTKQQVIKVLCNSTYGYMGNKQAPIGDDDIASSVTLTGQSIIKHAGYLMQQYLENKHGITNKKDLEESWIYSDTDSIYFSLECIQDKVPIIANEAINPVFYETVKEVEDYLNTEITTWATKNLRTIDSRFVFKRECISDIAMFLQKKRYVMHILDDEGIRVDKYKYTGVEVVRTTMPNAIKPYAKKIIETMLSTQSQAATTSVLMEAYEEIKKLPAEDIAFVMGVKGYEKYASQCNGFAIAKGMPIHVKASYLHNHVNELLNIAAKHEKLSSGDKVRYYYVEQPNKYGVDAIGFKYTQPEEYKKLFRIDYEKMFDKILFSSIERFYDSVKWRIRKPSEAVQTDLFDLFS